MKAYIKEKLLDELTHSQALTQQYKNRDTNFIKNTLIWIEGIENEFSKLRLAFVGVISAEKAKLLSVIKGENLTHTTRKIKEKNIAAVNTIDFINNKLYEEINAIDKNFEVWKDKIAQLSAISSKNNPIAIPIDGELSQDFLKTTWKNFGQASEGFHMHQYLSSILQQADLFYLLNIVINNLINNSQKIGSVHQ
ncbi:hypothetical protein [uncultured Shewanella sp.]|uniref:hypothetical protein n=1 Tax=uncultured Shewanella sp. TaxID=173975 RepID=UPI002615524E|nr:hypothetical protein [uncultured Shewanella sp.]